jgi:catechol 2,3-dioxygenase-like lactoylglutathione lyase family enzyme
MGVDLNPPAAPITILETVLYARDLDAIEDFYLRVLGLEPFAAAVGRHVFFKCGKQMLLIFNPSVTRNAPGPAALPVPQHGAEGHGHVCFRASSDEIAQWRSKLEAQDIAIEADFAWPGGGRSIYFRDPAGNCLEFAEPRIWGIE